jgi:glycosyltransferase involved in cell wall biosynthesis
MIIICEPQCIGFEHAGFNSVLMKTVEKAYGEEILFLGEETHIEQVKNIMGSDLKVNYRVIDVPPREQPDLDRLRNEFRLTKDVFALADSLNCDRLIFSSITRPGLISVKFYIRRFSKVQVLVIPHSLLDKINEFPRSRNFIFYFKFWLRFFNNKRLTYLLLGKTIKDELLKELTALNEYTEYVDHPFFFKTFELDDTYMDRELVFGFLGVGYRRKGIEDFIKLAKYVKAQGYAEKVKFILAGFIADADVEIEENSFLTASRTPLKQDDYFKYLKEVNYALFFHKAEDYRFTASGVFFDAISFLKPIIALKNPFIQYYFDLMGDIGYLCKDYEEMEQVVMDVIKNPDKKRYQKQQLNLKEGREKISTAKIAEELRQVWPKK